MNISENEIHLLVDGNGQVIKELDNGYSIQTKKQKEVARRNKDKRQDRRHFNFTDMEKIKHIISKLSIVHLGYLLHLQCFMEYGTGFLIGKDGKQMVTKTGIQQTLCVSKDINKRFTKALEENEILEKIDGKYRINPAYHFGGMAKERKVIKLFTTTLKLLAEVIKPAELGFLYKLLPYVHFDTNMICINPHEGQPELIQYLNEKAISELLNKDYKEVKTLLRKLRKAGVLAKTTGKDDERNNFHHLNPYIFYRKSGRPNDTLNGIFAASPYCPKK